MMLLRGRGDISSRIRYNCESLLLHPVGTSGPSSGGPAVEIDGGCIWSKHDLSVEDVTKSTSMFGLKVSWKASPMGGRRRFSAPYTRSGGPKLHDVLGDLKTSVRQERSID